MKKLISLILITILALTLLTSCASKVKLDANAEVVLSYQYDGTNVTSNLSGSSATLVIDNLSGLEITDEAPEGAAYDKGVYFQVGEQFFYLDLNGSSVIKVGDKGYVELEHYRYHAVAALFDQFGVRFHTH